MMRLSYEHDLSRLLTGGRQRVYETVLSECSLSEDDGDIYLNVSADALMQGIFKLGQGIARVEDMSLWTRPRVESAFYDDLRDIIRGVVPEQDRIESFTVPGIPNAENYAVDYMIRTPGKPLYLFGVLNRDKAMLTTIILQHLTQHAPSFDSMIVCSDIDDIPKKDARRLITVANDVVPAIQDRAAVVQKIEHRRAA